MCIAHYCIHKKNGHILENPGVNYLYIFYLFPSTTFIFPELSFPCSFSQMFCAMWKVKVAGQKRGMQLYLVPQFPVQSGRCSCYPTEEERSEILKYFPVIIEVVPTFTNWFLQTRQAKKLTG